MMVFRQVMVLHSAFAAAYTNDKEAGLSIRKALGMRTARTFTALASPSLPLWLSSKQDSGAI